MKLELGRLGLTLGKRRLDVAKEERRDIIQVDGEEDGNNDQQNPIAPHQNSLKRTRYLPDNKTKICCTSSSRSVRLKSNLL